MVLMQLAAAMLLHAPFVAVEGYVTDDATGVPLAGARVELPDASAWSLTDSTGHYVLRAAVGGSQRLRVARLGYETQAMLVVFPSLGTLRLDVALRAAPLRMPLVRVSALALRTPRGLAGDESHATHVRRLTSAQLRTHAALAEPDAFGGFVGEYDVSIAPESPSAFHVRGGSSDQVRLLIDGVPFYNSAHSAGVFGSVNADALDAVSLHTGPRTAAYGSTLAGTVVASTRRADSTAVRVRGGFAPTSARLTFDGPLIAGRSDFVASARRGAPSLLAGRADRTRLSAAFSDWLLKSTTRFGDGSLTLFATAARDRTGFSSRTEYDSAATAGPNARHHFDWSGASLAATWQHALRGGARYAVTAWRAEFDGDALWVAHAPAHLTSGRQTHGLQTALSTRAATLGVELQRDRVTYDVRDDASGRALAPAALRENHETSVALFGEYATTLTALHLRPGARLTFLTSGPVLLEPRLAASWNLTPALALKGGVARSYQTAQSLRNPESPAAAVFGADLAALSSGGLPVARSDELSLGIDAQAAGVRWFLDGYTRRIDGLALQRSGSALPFATSLPVSGRGRAHGLGTGAEWRLGKLTGLVTLGAADVRLEPSGDSAYQPAFATTRSLTTAAAYRLGTQTSLRSALFAQWGRRTTLYDGMLDWEACDVLDGGCEISGTPGDAIGARSARKLPPYVRWDVGVRHGWRVRVGARHVELEAHATLRNLLDRRNVWGYTTADGVAARALMWRPLSLLTAGLDFHY